MTENKYNQLKKREKWLSIILDYCDGKEVTATDLKEAIKAAKYFMSDMISKTYRYEENHDKTN